MLGKTHVLGSLAVMHIGFLGYTAYRNEPSNVTQSEPFQVFGFSIGGPFSLVEYLLMIGIVGLFVLWLLHIGSWQARSSYIACAIIQLILLYFFFADTYGVSMTLLFICFALGTLLPDIDSETSTIGKYVKPISRFIPHRTITHTIWVVLLLAAIAWYTESIYVTALAIGYWLHIVEDSFSDQGIHWFFPLMWPFRKKKRFPFSYETGGFGEHLMFYGSIGVHFLCVGFAVVYLL